MSDIKPEADWIHLYQSCMQEEGMVSTSEFRNGLVLLLDNELMQIVEFQHVKPGKGGAFVRTRLKNLKTERVIDRTFRSGERVEDVRLDKKTLQFQYKGGGDFHFMDTETYDQVVLSGSLVDDASKYIKEGMEVDVLFHDKEAIGVEVPIFVELTVVKTDPGVRGDTASGGTKPATLESGAVINVPLFLEEGTVVKVDTRTGIYVERIK
jgi:elongation factor P